MPHAAWPNAPEGQIILGNMQDGIVDRDAASDGLVEYLLDPLLVVVEEIKCQWPVMCIHVIERFLHVLVSKHGEQGAENFLLHYFHCCSGLQNQGGSDALRAIGLGL